MAGLSDIARGRRHLGRLALLIGFLHPVAMAGRRAGVARDRARRSRHRYVAKPFFNRGAAVRELRRSRVYGYKPTTRSFPSGHAASAIAGAYALARLAPEARAIFWILAVLIAFSRVYLGVHYPADVLAGALLGLAVGKFVWEGRGGALRRRPNKRKSRT